MVALVVETQESLSWSFKGESGSTVEEIIDLEYGRERSDLSFKRESVVLCCLNFELPAGVEKVVFLTNASFSS